MSNTKTENLQVEVQQLRNDWDVTNQKLLAAEAKLQEVTIERDQLKLRNLELENRVAAVAPVVAPVISNGFAEYPKILYFKGDAKNYQEVGSAEAEAALGEDWIDAPA